MAIGSNTIFSRTHAAKQFISAFEGSDVLYCLMGRDADWSVSGKMDFTPEVSGTSLAKISSTSVKLDEMKAGYTISITGTNSNNGSFVVDNSTANVVSVTGTDISFDNATATISSTATSFTGFNVGDTFTISGSIYNDGTYTIASVGANSIVVNETLQTETAGQSVTVEKTDYAIELVTGSTLVTESATGASIASAQYLPTPNPNLVQEQYDVWSNAKTAVKVNPGEMMLVVPRKDWSAGSIYTTFDPADETAWNTDFYVMNSYFEVFMCKTVGGSTSTVEPFLSVTDASGSTGVLADGYEWQYMYSLQATEVDKMLTTYWLPVPTSASRTWGTKEDKASYAKLGAKYVMILTTFGTNVNYSGVFKQTGLVKNPTVSGVVASANTYQDSTYTGADPLFSTMDVNSGEMVYIENRESVSRQSTQFEEFRTVLVF